MSRPSFLLFGALLASALVATALMSWALMPRAAVCAVPTLKVLTLKELVAGHADLNGCIVRVRGFLSQWCGGYDCSLASTRQSLGMRMSDPNLAIGWDEDFDRRARPFLDREVMFAARFDDQCVKPPPPDTKIMCLDRFPELQPVPNTPITLLESK